MGLAYVNFAAKWYCSQRATSPVTEIFLRFCWIFFRSYLEGLRGVETERVWRIVEESRGNGKVSVCVQ